MLRILLASLLLLAPRALGAPDRPNILFIMSDDHAWQAIGAYGSNRNTTPNIDRLAREGVRLDRFFVGNSICAPSRATMLTGLHSHANGVPDNSAHFDGSQRHVARMLRDAGYQTAMFGKWHLKTEPTGFDHYDRLVGQGFYYNPKMRRADDEEPYEEYVQTGASWGCSRSPGRRAGRSGRNRSARS